MKKAAILFTLLLILTYCKGPGSGPLVRESSSAMDQTHGMKSASVNNMVKSERIDITIEPGADCITIANLLADRKLYSGKTVKVRGKVTKFNPEIMGKNWVHLQDGSQFGEEFDVALTTDITVSVGDTITFEGKVALDKDFGYGYLYSVLIEGGKRVK